MPIIAAIIGQPDFSALSIDIGDAEINYGTPTHPDRQLPDHRLRLLPRRQGRTTRRRSRRRMRPTAARPRSNCSRRSATNCGRASCDGRDATAGREPASMVKMFRRRSLVAALALAVVAVGCGATDSEGDDTIPPVTPVPTLAGVGDVPAVPSAVREPVVAVRPPVEEDGTDAELIGDLVDGNRVLMIGDSILASTSSRYGNHMCDAVVPLGLAGRRRGRTEPLHRVRQQRAGQAARRRRTGGRLGCRRRLPGKQLPGRRGTV